MENSEYGKTMSAGESPQTRPETQHIEVSQRGESVESLADFLTKILAPVSSGKSPEPDVLRITLELPSVAYFLRSDAPVPKEILQLYSLKKTGTPTKELFPAYLRLVAEKWEEVLLLEGAARVSAKE